MRKLLLFFAMLLMAIVVNAKPINWTDGTYTVTGADAGDQKQTLTVSGPGALAAFVAATKDLQGGGPENEPLQDLGKDANRVNLVITGELNADDLAALNSTVSGCGNLATFKTLDLSGATFSIDDISGMNLGGLEYLRLANSMTSAADVKKMGALKQNGNANLKMVGAYDDTKVKFNGGNYAAVALYSYEENNVTPFIAQMNIPTSGNPPTDVCEIRMAGEYGEKDLVSNGATGVPNFGHGTSAEWDFTGAHFADCTIPAANAAYYNYDDPFCEGGLVANTTSSNAFYYFSQYKTAVIDIKLPDTNMTNLPAHCLEDLGAANKTGYVALYGESAFDANKAETNCVPLESLVIPDCYTDLEEECGKWARIRHLVIGSGMKRIHGGAFLKCDFLEDLDFAAGLSDCYVGDRSFNECKSMKHIALSEGIVSLGNGAFWNSQHLESIRLPQSLINIGNNSFNNCLALNSITIPENVEKIGQGAFILCPFTDIYLTTTDPAKIPEIWTAGNSFDPKDEKATFYSPDFDGNNGIPNQASEIPSMSWEEAAQWYYVRANGIPVLHYPKELAEKVRAEISSTYGGRTNDNPAYGLPLQGDRIKRANIPGADLGTAGNGKYSQDGWAQLMLMKEFTTDPGGDVYTKLYEDVWYTMCFPFDLTDEQLAAAFNETFNIVDFSGVEIKEEDETAGTPKKLVLHFNKVAKTYYRDNKGNEYEVIGRETDDTSKFEYNIYRRDGVEYHHSQVSALLSTNKTKTFAPGNSIAESNANKDNAIIIDGVLATAGHPYMIHPAIGTSIGDPKRCDFSGISWKPMTQWASIFEAQKREVDLGEARGTINEEDFKQSTPDADNYTQAAYTKYAGQTYTFIGNANTYNDNCPPEPYVGNGLADYPPYPTKAAYPTEPVAVSEPTITLDDFEAQNKPAVVEDPEITWTDADETLYAKLTSPNDWELVWYGETEITATYNNDSPQWQAWQSKKHLFQNMAGVPDPYADEQGCFEKCKATFNNKAKVAAYQQYLVDLDAYNNAYADLEAQWTAYNAFDPEAYANEHDQWEQDCQDIDDDFDAAVTQWEQDCQDIDESNAAIHAAWVQTAMSYQRLIPTGAYFLGRRGLNLPKYYREIADDTRTDATGGFWTQFTAVVIPNDAAKSGIENELDGKTASSKGFDMAFDEGFLGEFIEQDDVVTLIEKAKEEGAKVEYMDIVVSINGEVVRRGTTSIEGLPKGIYIVNGKKYFVK